MELGRYRYVRIKANLVYCVKNTAQPTYHKHMGVRIKAGRGQAEFIQVPEMLTFIEDGSGWPGPQPHLSQGRGTLSTGPSVSEAQIQFKLQLLLPLYLPVTELAFLLSPHQKEGRMN